MSENLHLEPLDPSFLHEEETHFIVAHAEHLLEELDEIAKICGECLHAHSRTKESFSPNRELIWEAVEVFLMNLQRAERPQKFEIFAATERLRVELMQQLSYTARQAATQVGYLRAVVHGQDFSPTSAFLVSPLWSRRMYRTLGGQLFPAYVGAWHFLSTEHQQQY